MNLEEKVTKGFVVYIHSIVYDDVDKNLVINFIKDPATDLSVIRTLTFSEIENFSEEIDDEDFDEDCLDSLIGLQEYPLGNGVRYVIRTEQREMIFATSIKPCIWEVTSL